MKPVVMSAHVFYSALIETCLLILVKIYSKFISRVVVNQEIFVKLYRIYKFCFFLLKIISTDFNNKGTHWSS